MTNRGQQLEELLTVVFNKLREAEKLTEGKIDLEFMLSIVGSFIVAKENGKLEGEYKTPSELFEERVFTIVDDSTLVVEEIKDEGE
jgi:hypothetical protein